MAPQTGRATSRLRPRHILTGALGFALLSGTAGGVQAGLLDALFGGARAYAPPVYRYEPGPFAYPYDAPPPRRRAARTEKAPDIEVAPARMESTCCKNGEDPMKALLTDDTLVRGDVVMTPTGLRTFVGARAPHSERDFVAIGKSQMISSKQKKQLLALDR